MKILMVSAEFAPWAKTGGLADAVAGLSNALCERGHDVRVLLPRYAKLATPASSQPIETPLGPASLAELPHPTGTTPRIFAVALGALTTEHIYTGDARDASRFLRLAAAGAAFGATGWHPEVVHCHDWHAALTPVLQKLCPTTAPSVLTLHNVGYQGVFAADALAEHGTHLDGALPVAVKGGADINFLRAGLTAATRITTVSPTYATEILEPMFGMGLEDILNSRRNDLRGILNGVDYGVWSPTHDPFIATPYSSDEPEGKRRNKRALLTRLGLDPDEGAPLIGLVTRLAAQKGIDLFIAALPTLLRETRARCAILGSGDAALTAELNRHAGAAEARIAFVDGYDEALAHQIFAGADFTLVPSRYEPCGLTQMYALRYGTIPVVRATGGLADTVQHFDTASGRGNGSVFRDADVGGVLWGLRTALGWFDDATTWPRLVANAMASDFSWQRQVLPYEALYRSLR